jgi:phosphoserine phosphatase
MAVSPATRVEVPQEVLDVVRDDEELWNTMPAAEMQKYARQYVATRGKRVVAAAPTHRALRRQLQEQGIQTACISYMEDPDDVIVYLLR